STARQEIQWDRVLNRALLYLVVAIFFFVVLLPFYWIFMSSFTPKFQMFSIPPRYFPQQITLDNYINMARAIPFYRYLSNSLIFALGSSISSVVLAFLASYALGRIRFRGSNVVFMLFILSIAVPQIGTVVPIFEMFKKFGLVNSRLALIMLMSSLITPFTVWIMVPFIQQIPVEIEEAASIDGARLPQLLWHVVVPVMRPALATMLIINFIIAWNELLYPLVFATGRLTKTLSVGLVELAVDPSMGAGRPWDLMSSLSVTMIIPVLLLVLFFQRLIISGLTRGAVK
ncbi:MAG TPA: carbohydrate ABC transporter permease, partial [Chloroflexota bacterium]